MASQRRPAAPAVIQQLFADPQRFDFFQAVRLLERNAQQPDAAAARPGYWVPRPARGPQRRARQELVRFRARQSLEFPVSEIESLVRPASPAAEGDQAAASSPAGQPPAAQPEMLVNFMGLTGPAGVLPRHYSQLILDREREGAEALVNFLDGFNHRLISLFYRAWEKYRAAINIEQSRYAGSPADLDLFSFAMFSLVGLGTGGQRGRLVIDDDYFLYYAGCFSQRPPNPLCLQRMLQELLKTKIFVQQLFGQWLQLSPDEQTRMTVGGEAPTLRVQLGRGAVAGERVWDLQSKFRIRIGPVDYAFFRRMMPSTDRLLSLCQFVRSYVGPELDFDVQLLLRGPEAPWCALDGNARLGWNTWVRVNAFQRDLDDVVFWLRQV